MLKDVSWSGVMIWTGKYNPLTRRGNKYLGVMQPRVRNRGAQKILHITVG